MVGLDRGIVEMIGNAVRVYGDQAERGGILHRPDTLRDAPLGKRERLAGEDIAQHHFTASRAHRIFFAHDNLFFQLAVGRLHPSVLADAGIDTQHWPGRGLKHADDLRFIAAVLLAGEAGEKAIADARRAHPVAIAGPHDMDHGRGRFVLPARGAGDGLTVLVEPHDLNHRDGGQRALRRELALAALLEMSLVYQFFEKLFEIDTVRALDIERAGDLALADGRLALVNESADLLLAREVVSL